MPGLGDVAEADAELARSLRWTLDNDVTADLCLAFSATLQVTALSSSGEEEAWAVAGKAQAAGKRTFLEEVDLVEGGR